MKRILILGCSGAGKSTLSRTLAEKTGLPLYHIDKIFWYGDWEHLEKDALDAEITKLTETDEWIIDGNYSRTIPLRLEKADTVIYLDYPRRVCVMGVLRRVFGNYGKVRPDMGGNCAERFDMEFMKFVWTFNKKKRPGIMALLKDFKGEIHIFKSRKETSKFLEGLEK